MSSLFGTHPITLRLDDTGALDELVVSGTRSPSTGTAFISATIHGYLVNLP